MHYHQHSPVPSQLWIPQFSLIAISRTNLSFSTVHKTPASIHIPGSLSILTLENKLGIYLRTCAIWHISISQNNQGPRNWTHQILSPFPPPNLQNPLNMQQPSRPSPISLFLQHPKTQTHHTPPINPDSNPLQKNTIKISSTAQHGQTTPEPSSLPIERTPAVLKIRKTALKLALASLLVNDLTR